jgi:hypothetical protein
MRNSNFIVQRQAKYSSGAAAAARSAAILKRYQKNARTFFLVDMPQRNAVTGRKTGFRQPWR